MLVCVELSCDLLCTKITIMSNKLIAKVVKQLEYFWNDLNHV